MFEAYKIGIAIRLANHVSPVLATITKDFGHANKSALELQKSIHGIKTGLVGGLMTAGAGIAIAAMFKTPIQDALKFERAMLRIKNIGGMDAVTIKQVQSDALSGKYKGIGAAESVDLFRDLHAAFGDAKHAQEFMPLFAGMARVTQGLYGKSALQGEEDVKAMAKLAERRGGTAGPKNMESAMDLSMRILNASGGAVTPKDLYAFTSRMGAMGIGMSNDGMMKMWALMQEQGGSKAGTALNSSLQNLVNGRGTEGSGNVLRRIGWIDETKNQEGLKSLYGANWSKHLNKVTANSLKNSDLAKEDMVGWVQTTGLPLIDSYLTKKGVTDPKKRQAETVSLLAQALSNRLGADSIALIATQLPRIMKDYHIAESSSGLRKTTEEYDKSNVAKFQDLTAKWDVALVNLGVVALPIVIPLVNKLTEALKNLTAYAQKNPGVIGNVVKGLFALSGILITMGGLTLFVNGFRALALIYTTLSSTGFVSVLIRVGTALVSANAAVIAFGGAVGWLLGSLIANPLINWAVQKMTGDKNTTLGSKVYDWTHQNENPTAPVNTVKSAANARPIQVYSQIHVNGKVLGDAVTTHQVKEASRPSSGASRTDGSMMARPIGASGSY